MKIYLVGLPGCGKTYLGEKLAERLSLPFYDLDCLIIEHEGKDINSIFQEKGEEYFRKVEAQLLREITFRKKDFLLSTGGGAACYHENMSFINQHGISIYLDVPIPVIANRLLTKGIEERPLLKEKKQMLQQELTEKLKERKKYYEQAKILLSGENISADSVIDKISNDQN